MRKPRHQLSNDSHRVPRECSRRASPSPRRKDRRRSAARNPNRRALSQSDAPLTQGRGTWCTIPEGLGKAGHVNAARALVHPLQRDGPLDQTLRDAIDHTLETGSALNEWREATIRHLRSLAESFKEAHAALVRRVHPSIQSIVARINVPLFRHLLEKYDYDDPTAADVCAGAPIVGELDGPEEWPPQQVDDQAWTEDDILFQNE